MNPIKILQKDRFTAKYSPSNHEPPPSLITSGELEVHEPEFTGRDYEFTRSRLEWNAFSPVVNSWTRVHDLNGTQHNTCFLGLNRVQIPNGISTGSAIFAQLTTERPYSLPPQNCPFPRGLYGHHLIQDPCIFRPTRVLNPSGISIGSAIFLELTAVTDRHTDRQIMLATQSEATDRIYVLRTAMQPKNNLCWWICNEYNTSCTIPKLGRVSTSMYSLTFRVRVTTPPAV